MTAFGVPFEPAAKPGHVVRLSPDGDLRRVRDIEQLAVLDTIDFGAITSGNRATESNREEIPVNELEIHQNQIGQYRVYPIHPVKILVAQVGAQEVRFNSGGAGGRGGITRNTPEPQREVFVQGEGEPHFIVENNMQWDFDKSFVQFSGYKLVLEPGELKESDVTRQPISLPTEKLEQQSQTQSGASGRQPAGASQVARRGQ